MNGVLPPPFRLVSLERVGSTNDEAKRLAADGAAALTVVQAVEQTAGRGRRGRVWQSPPGNLHCSLILDPGDTPARAAELAFVAAVALRDALAELAPGRPFTCKWPNDILCAGRKIAGMLLEAAPPRVILGIGVDVVAAPDPALYPATCLRREGSGAVASDVLALFCAQFEPWYRRWRQDGFAPLREAWLARAAGLGGSVTVRLADGVEQIGRFAGLDGRGALLLQDAAGDCRPILAGDVFLGA